MTGVFTSAGFGAVSGSSVAAIASMGILVMPQMKKYNYDLRLATESLASASTLAIMILPPIHPHGHLWRMNRDLHRKAVYSRHNPGTYSGHWLLWTIVVRCILNKDLGPAGPRFSCSDRLVSLSKMFPTACVYQKGDTGRDKKTRGRKNWRKCMGIGYIPTCATDYIY